MAWMVIRWWRVEITEDNGDDGASMAWPREVDIEGAVVISFDKVCLAVVSMVIDSVYARLMNIGQVNE